MKLFLIILIFGTFVFCDSSETLIYGVYYNGIKAGDASLEYIDNKEKNIANLTFKLKSKKIIDLVYKLREKTSITINTANYAIQKINKYSRQGRHKKQYNASFNYMSQTGYYNDRNISVFNPIYDPLTIVYYLRNQDFSQLGPFTFDVFAKDKIKKINMEVIGEETITFNNSELNCLIFGPMHNNNQSKNSDAVKVWISTGQNQLPLIIEKKAKYGVLRMQLEKQIIEDNE